MIIDSKCKDCGIILTEDNIYNMNNQCKKCYNKHKNRRQTINQRTYRKKQANRVKNARLLAKYNITLDDYNQILKSQNNKCAICSLETTELVVDHCHTSGKIRGLLCHRCNLGLGHFKDSCMILDKAKNYLNK